MKLFEVLNKYYVMALNSSEIVDFSTDASGVISITWSNEDGEHHYDHPDQEIQLLDHPRGGFYVEDTAGNQGGFIALDGVALT